jgi:hypothetical protein
MASPLVLLLSARVVRRLGVRLAALAAGGLAATFATVMRTARLVLMFGHDDPFAGMTGAVVFAHSW